MHKICEICKKAPATVHLTDIHNNVKKELHMCEQCAAQKGISLKQTASLQQVLKTLDKKINSVIPEEKAQVDDANEIVCGRCGISWSEFRQKGRFGCAHDYEAFNGPLLPMIEEIHGRTAHHVGKTPENAGHTEVARKRHEILECQRKLREAVELEHYEEAAGLRDRLATLKEDK